MTAARPAAAPGFEGHLPRKSESGPHRCAMTVAAMTSTAGKTRAESPSQGFLPEAAAAPSESRGGGAPRIRVTPDSDLDGRYATWLAPGWQRQRGSFESFPRASQRSMRFTDHRGEFFLFSRDRAQYSS